MGRCRKKGPLLHRSTEKPAHRHLFKQRPDFPTRRSPVFLVIYPCVANWSGLTENAKTPTETTLADYESVTWPGEENYPSASLREGVIREGREASAPSRPWSACTVVYCSSTAFFDGRSAGDKGLPALVKSSSVSLLRILKHEARKFPLQHTRHQEIPG